MRSARIAMKGLAVAALAAVTMAQAAEPYPDPGHIGVPAGASESGVPPPEMRLRAIVARALDDSISTWKRLVATNALEVGNVTVRFVAHLSPGNCFGLYTGDGPAYCSGNATVFVGVDAANRLMSRFGAEDEAGITFLIGHEIGHHIQNIFGRFQLLQMVARSQPWSRAEFQRRFELEADCYAGVWIQASDAWAKSETFRSEMRAVVGSIGDDRLQEGGEGPKRPGAHGSSEQRVRWFERGIRTGNLRACDTFAVADL